MNGKLALLPWLNLEKEVTAGDVTFAPCYRDGNVHHVLQPVEEQLKELLAFFRDPKDDPVRTGTFAFLAPCNFALGEDQVERVGSLAPLLLLACFAENQYFCSIGPYVNSAAFALYLGTLPFSGVASFEIRRRDGMLPYCSYTSEMFRFALPPQCDDLSPRCDEVFLRAMVSAMDRNSPALERTESALPFFAMANTDASSASPGSELMMLVAAYERLLGPSSGSKIGFSQSVGQLLGPFGNKKTVEDARKAGRPVDPRMCPGKEDELSAAPVHQGWAYDLYQARSEATHHKPQKVGTSRGWSPFEHLVMGAVLFPLLVKLLLKDGDFCQLAPRDVYRLRAVDRILIEQDWTKRDLWVQAEWNAVVDDISAAGPASA